MNKQEIETKALNLFADCCRLGLNSSYLSVLNTMYETAAEKKQDVKCNLINQLISEEINTEQ